MTESQIEATNKQIRATIANKAKRYPTYAESFEDLVNEGWLAVLEQQDSFDETKSSWNTFVDRVVMNHYKNLLRDSDRDKRVSNTKARRVNFSEEYSTPPAVHGDSQAIDTDAAQGGYVSYKQKGTTGEVEPDPREFLSDIVHRRTELTNIAETGEGKVKEEAEKKLDLMKGVAGKKRQLTGIRAKTFSPEKQRQRIFPGGKAKIIDGLQGRGESRGFSIDEWPAQKMPGPTVAGNISRLYVDYGQGRKLVQSERITKINRVYQVNQDPARRGDAYSISPEEFLFPGFATWLTAEKVWRIIYSWDSFRRDIFVLKYREGKKHKEIARSLSISTSTIQKHIEEGINLIQIHFNVNGEEIEKKDRKWKQQKKKFKPQRYTYNQPTAFINGQEYEKVYLFLLTGNSTGKK